MGKGATRRRAVARGSDDVQQLTASVAAVAKAITSEGAILKSTLGDYGVERSQVADSVARLAADGVELTGRFLRVPLEKQLDTLLSSSRMLPFRELAVHLHGASKREAAAAALDLVATGRARIVVRSTEVFVAAASAPHLDERDLARLEEATAVLAKALKLARKHNGSLLRADVDETLRRAWSPGPAAGRSGARPSPANLLDAIDANRETSGLASVPRVVRALGGLPVRDAVHAELLKHARAGRLELRPESGMGRLTPDDAALCLPGPQGSKLSWVRRLEESP